MRWFSPLLFPFSILFGAVTSVRNRLYDTGAKPSASFAVPVIGVGNLSVGGTGKTPMIEYLIRLLSDTVKVATLSRGYGRKSRGIRIARDTDDATTIGDEPFQFFRKFRDKVVVAVGEERALAIPYILDQHPEIGVILLDDAFQHRRVKPTFQVLLTDYNHLFVNDYLLPLGRLRESRRGASRADAIVVTKCPHNISEDDMMAIERSIRRYSTRALFFARIAYGNILPATTEAPYRPEKIVLVSGIADPAPLVRYFKDRALVHHFVFADHHLYSRGDLDRICEKAAKAGAVVVTTEKDVVKMDVDVFRAARVALYYLPIEIEFLKNGKEFDEMTLNAVRTNAR